MVAPAANGLILPQHLSTGKFILASTMGSSDDFRGMLDPVTKHQIKPIVWKEIEAPSGEAGGNGDAQPAW